jgi:hypothetical protein
VNKVQVKRKEQEVKCKKVKDSGKTLLH